MKTPSRREFLQRTALGAFTIAQAGAVRSYAANDTLNLAFIGATERSTELLRYGLAAMPDVQVIGITEPYPPRLTEAMSWTEYANAKILICEGCPTCDLTDEQRKRMESAIKPQTFEHHEAMLDALEGQLDAVVVDSPAHLHAEHVLAALDRGLHVYCIPPIALTTEDARRIVMKCRDKGRFVLVADRFRYQDTHNLAMEYAYKPGYLGRITQLVGQHHEGFSGRLDIERKLRVLEIGEANAFGPHAYAEKWNPYLNGHLDAANGGALFTQHAAAQLSLANWFLQSAPVRIYADAGLESHKDGRTAPDHLALIADYEIKPGAAGYLSAMNPWFPKREETPAPYTVRFVFSGSLDNLVRRIGTDVTGQLGILRVGTFPCTFFAEPSYGFSALNPGPDTELFERAMLEKGFLQAHDTPVGTHWTDRMREGYKLEPKRPAETSAVHSCMDFADKVRNGGTPRVNQMDGLMTVAAIDAAIKSARKGHPVDIPQSDYAFDFETPATGCYEAPPA